MIKSVQVPLLLKKALKISLNSGIHTDTVLFGRTRKNTVSDEPGIQYRKDFLLKDEDYFDECDDHIMDERLDEMTFGKNPDIEEEIRQKRKIQKAIISKKFFAPRRQPATLTYNERLCIRYLHKTDPIQWNIKTLSQGFPATPEVIKKVLKSKLILTPEEAKVMDLKVQRNWEQLAEGKLDADPDVIEHLKKFVNRREILLEQIKNEKFYLPEVKKEPVWNQGEMSGILAKYEKALEKLACEMQTKEKHKMLNDGAFEEKDLEKKRKSTLDVVHEKIEERATSKELEAKDSFVLGEMINTYSDNVTFEELEKKILRKAEKRKKLHLLEKAIIEDKLNGKSQENFTGLSKNELGLTKQKESESVNTEEREEKTKKGFIKDTFNMPDKKVKFRDSRNNCRPEFIEMPDIVFPDERTQFTNETGIGKFLNKPSNETLPENDSSVKTENTKKKTIDFSDPERLRREALYYDQEVRHIQNTSFWDSGKTSKDKAMEEYKKQIQETPADFVKTKVPGNHVLSSEPYPERIKIPKKMKGSGLVFKVKDCYYDDDGEFLYRVPGMYR